MVGEVPGAVDRRAVTPPEYVLLLKALLREIDPEGLILMGLWEPPDLLDDPVNIPDPDKIALPDEPVVMGIQSGESRSDSLHTERDGRPERAGGLGVTAFHPLHEVINLFGDLGVLLDPLVRSDIDSRDVVIFLLALLTGDAKVIEPPGDDGDLAAHIVQVILHLKRVPGLPERPGKGVPDDGISDMADVEGTVWVCTGMFEHHPLRVTGELSVAELEGLPDRLREE